MSPTSTAPAGTRSRNNFSNKACSLTACSPDIAPHTGGIANPVSRSWATSIFTTGKCDSPCWFEVGGNAIELAREGVPLPANQRQLGHSYVSTTSVYLQGIDVEEIIGTIHARRAPMMHASAGLEL